LSGAAPPPDTPALEALPALAAGEHFRFACHPDVSCFNACCRRLDLLLYPYDVLRLRRALDLSSSALLERHGDLIALPGHGLPMVQLRMSAAPSAPCPFVTEAGCAVYAHRPAACRCYPLGRGSWLDDQGEIQARHVVVREPHCHGFETGSEWTAESWLSDQELENYNQMNDRYTALAGHIARCGRPLDERRAQMVLFALYQVDRFRDYALSRDAAELALSPQRREEVAVSDEAALLLGFEWLETRIRG